MALNYFFRILLKVHLLPRERSGMAQKMFG
jgi:hypothetical protein